ncbi:LOW QUALITY PROTEIN: hypothetical protein V3C99_001111 [Haemonchus contortus]
MGAAVDGPEQIARADRAISRATSERPVERLVVDYERCQRRLSGPTTLA